MPPGVTDPEELAAWLRLLETPQVGRLAARRLLAAFGSPQAVLEASVAARRAVVGQAAAAALAVAPVGICALVQSTVDWLACVQGSPRSVLTLADANYPALLLESADPPLLLYALGRIDLLQSPSVAVVGSRDATPQGKDNARAFASHISQAGLTIVSGLALGIDGAAHEGALEGRGSTIAVVGTGLDRVYPRRHHDLARRIAESGLLISEYALGTPPLAHHFPQRNRIISGLARATLVVEATLQSGSLITARLALESGRDVYAVPGSIHAPQSRGCHSLIKQGAKLVESAQDVLEEFDLPVMILRPTDSAGTASATAVNPTEAASNPQTMEVQRVLDAMGYDPVGLDALIDRTGCSAPELNVRLLDLELNGQVARLPGQLFQRLGRG